MDIPVYELTDLGLLPGTTQCHATGLNNLRDRYQAVGYCSSVGPGNVEGNYKAFIWEQLARKAGPEQVTLTPLLARNHASTQALGMNNIYPSTVVGSGANT